MASPKEWKPRSFEATQVPAPKTFPEESLWMKLPPPVAEKGRRLKVPLPVTVIVSPFSAVEMTGQASGARPQTGPAPI